MMKDSEFKSLNFSLIGKQSSIEGDLTFSGDTLINGKIKGSITIVDGGKLTLERSSFVEGQIYCNDLEIFGEFQGQITANGCLTVRSSGVISGNVNAAKMNIYPGAMINIEGKVEEKIQEVPALSVAPPAN